MSLDRALQLHTAALAILGAVFVGLRPEASLVPALSAVVAVAAVALTDVLGWLRLNRWLANVMAIGAVAWSLREFFQIASEEQLMAIAHMLCYLQMVLLFQEKTTRVFWQIVVLSTLQVVVAAALDLGPQFGLLLGLYALIAISTLVLLCIYREVKRPPVMAGVTSRSPPREWTTLLAAPQVLINRATETDVRRGLTASIIARQTALLAVVTVLFAAVFFYATPRLSEASWLAGRSQAAGISGFRAELQLEERGRIHLSNQVVMRVSLTRMKDRKAVELIGEPYFHGAALTDYTYDELGGRWLPWRHPDSPRTGQRLGSPQIAPQTNTNLVRQDIVLEGTASGRRFAIMPMQAIPDQPEGRPYAGGGRRAEEAAFVSRQQRYSFATPAIFENRQLPAIPNPNRLQTLTDVAIFDAEMEHAKTFYADRFRRLAEIAAEVVNEQGLLNGKALNKAEVLERHFLAPDRYHYSLHLDFHRDHDLDPIEDFVSNHRTGHCEYFASALVLMLRSQGIPARLIWGYKGGAYNSLGHYYNVQQRHSHAWVEAWLAPGEAPETEIAGKPSEGGTWYRLDPTPGSEIQFSTGEEGVGERVAQAFDYIELLWRDYVLGLNQNRQDDIVYEPLTAQTAILPAFPSVQRWLRRMSIQLGLDLPIGGGRGGPRAIEGSLAFFVTGGLLLLLFLAYGLRLAGRAFARWRPAKAGGSGSHAPPFYRQLERLLARLPLIRRAGQTPQELAQAAANRLAAAEAPAEAAPLPPQIVAAYYRVRFGAERLDKNESVAIEQALAALAAAVRQRSNK
jgi:hypothetical protein